MFDGGLRLGRRLGSLQGPLAGWRRGRLAVLFDSGATLRLQYPKEDLGFVYTDSGVRIPGVQLFGHDRQWSEEAVTPMSLLCSKSGMHGGAKLWQGL